VNGAVPTVAALDPQALARGVIAGDRVALGRALTLVESRKPAHQPLAEEMLAALMPHTSRAIRVGMSGVPGAGKSTLIERLGLDLIEAGHTVAVLAVDPSSHLTGGSILGDKTRMAGLAVRPEAFIRPSPAAGSLGGVARRSYESLLVCEAAGFDVVLVETVGVGQSETVVTTMTDTFVVLLTAGAGDELQGIKRGVLEEADIVVVTKADGGNENAARAARAQYEMALHLTRPAADNEQATPPVWAPRVLTLSAVTGQGVDTLWTTIAARQQFLERTGELARRRGGQALHWLWTEADAAVLEAFHGSADVQALAATLTAGVKTGELAATVAARKLALVFKP
jgi:LAO/AO transport system kinase